MLLNTVNSETLVANNVKRHICDVKSLQLVQDLPSSVNGIVISLFCEAKLCMCLNLL